VNSAAATKRNPGRFPAHSTAAQLANDAAKMRRMLRSSRSPKTRSRKLYVMVSLRQASGSPVSTHGAWHLAGGEVVARQ
jgi:hypothetical protein